LSKSETAFAFPGVAAGLAGTEAAFLGRHRARMRPALSLASEAAGTDLEKALTDGIIETLGALESQLFTYAFSVGMASALAGEGLEPALVGGHSLGVYAQMAASRSVTVEEGLTMVEEAYRLSKSAVAKGRFGMAGVLGLTAADVQDLLGSGRFEGLRAVIANSSISHVVAGPHAALERFLAEAEKAGATKTAWIDREVPYHHPEILADASKQLDAVLSRIDWRPAAIPVVSSIDGRLLREPAELRDYTARNLCTPIAWEQVVKAFHVHGASTVVECGPGFALTKIGRFIDVPLKYLSIKNLGRGAE
jgi:[acyl-carrier-protein] S-malonyltransferase